MDLVRTFSGFQRIYCLCPCCGEIFRLSDAQLFVSTPPPKTEFDEINDAMDKLEAAISRFNEQEGSVRDASRRRGQEAARSRLSAIAPFFVSQGIDPNDVKVLFDPVLYLAFQGMTSGACTELRFIDPPADTEGRRKLHRSLSSALRAGNLEWRTFNVQDDGCIISS